MEEQVMNSWLKDEFELGSPWMAEKPELMMPVLYFSLDQTHSQM